MPHKGLVLLMFQNILQVYVSETLGRILLAILQKYGLGFLMALQAQGFQKLTLATGVRGLFKSKVLAESKH